MKKMFLITTTKVPFEGIIGLSKDGKTIVIRRAEMYTDDVLDEDFVMLMIDEGYMEIVEVEI